LCTPWCAYRSTIFRLPCVLGDNSKKWLLDAFERFARRWMELVDRHGGSHHGYFLPAEGASD
jgi:hypothetical protein